MNNDTGSPCPDCNQDIGMTYMTIDDHSSAIGVEINSRYMYSVLNIPVFGNTDTGPHLLIIIRILV